MLLVYLFKILNLFSNLFEFCFALDHGLAHAGIVGFGSNGVEFPVDLLAKKVKRASDRFVRVEITAKATEMGIETGGFLGDVATIRKQGNLF